jgi:Zn-dependent M32 family carboxypeptidase
METEGRGMNNRERNTLATYEARVRDAKKLAYEQIKPDLIAIFTAQRALLEPGAKASGLNPSDLVTSEWNPNIVGREIDAVLDKIRGHYPAIIQAAADKEAKDAAATTIALPSVPMEVQEKIFGRIRAELLAAGGWNEQRIADAGIKANFQVIDGNSMCWGTPSEYYEIIQSNEDGFILALGQNMPHEPGHELYLLNLHEADPAYRDQPVARINGYSTHEVCAMTMDGLGNTRKYYELAEPIIRDELRKANLGANIASLDADGPAWNAENLYLHSRKPQGQDWSSGTVDCVPQVAWRVKAERALLDGPMSVEEAVDNLPRLWADTMTEYTGEKHDPADFAAIEEDHWFTGMAGYFYAYLHGAMGAAMVHQKLNRDGLAKNDAKTLREYFEPFVSFLKTNINDKGRLNTPMDTLRAATGMEPGLDAFIARVTGGAFGEGGRNAPQAQAPGIAKPDSPRRA